MEGMFLEYCFIPLFVFAMLLFFLSQLEISLNYFLHHLHNHYIKMLQDNTPVDILLPEDYYL